MSKNITIKDVARDANVSITTASFALNDVKGRVSEKVRKRVLESAERLQYTVNNSARSLRTNDSRTVMFVFSKEYLMERNVSYMLSLAGCVEYADQMGKGILLELIDAEMPMEEQIRRFMSLWESRRVNGMIFQCYFEDDRDDELYRRLYGAGVNLVNLSRIGASSDYPCVYLEEFQIVRDQVRYAVKKGYDRIYYFCKQHRQPGVRERGFLDELAGENAQGRILHYHSLNCTEEEAWQAVGPVMEEGKRIAVICWNDADAIVLLRVLRKRGIAVPDRIGVMGFDNIPLAEYVTPRLTTASQPFAEMAKRALEVLDNADKAVVRVPERVLVSGEIIERESM